MTKDFKKQAAAGSAFGQYGLGWMVGGVAIGLLIGAGMYALANKGNAPDATTTTPPGLNTTSLGDTTNPATSTLSTTDVTATGDNGGTSTPQNLSSQDQPSDETPGFSYHAVLPQLEIDVPLAVQVEQQAAATKEPPDTKKPVAAAPPPKQADKKTVAVDTPKADTPKPETKKAPPAAAITGANALQIGSYKTQDQAADMQNRLKKKGLNSRVETANIQGATWFRVRVGPASSPEMLQKWQQTLSGMGISPMAIRM
ncbi:MAG: SPOR domain-containing protein [Candidatus Thiothrix putei]|uniref:SPOR domain-containing protein n=1 Tax=Candidatus Thiothrix putei TaxID=3080811 RepID=A0AA95KQ98_9GAMM|nr:MAG: SPOR domain-containing protein [Candidatus Thiothrix putei]